MHEVLRSPGAPLERGIRDLMEERLGADFGDVRVHTGDVADRAARSVAADAFTVGSHIAFRAGAYDPSSAAGQRLFAHELAHVTQHRGLASGTAGGIRISDPGDRFELEAEAASRRAISGTPAGRGAEPSGPPLTPPGPFQPETGVLRRAGLKTYQQPASDTEPGRNLPQCALLVKQEVETAARQIGADPELTGYSGTKSTGYLAAWITTYREYRKEPETLPGWIYARYGYAVETLATALLANTPISPYKWVFQVAHGHTRPDIVVMGTVDGKLAELAWIDITSQDSLGHITKKQGSGWTARPYVAEVWYDRLNPVALLQAQGTLTPQEKERLAAAIANAAERERALAAGIDAFAADIGEALWHAAQNNQAGQISASQGTKEVRETANTVFGGTVAPSVVKGILSLIDHIEVGTELWTGQSLANWAFKNVSQNQGAAKELLIKYGEKGLSIGQQEEQEGEPMNVEDGGGSGKTSQ